MCSSDLRIGIAAFIVPFMFVYSPALLMQGSVLEVIRASVSAALGLACLAAALTGFAWRTLKGWERVVLVAACVALIIDRWMFDLAGVALAVIVLAPQWLRHRRNRSTQAVPTRSEEDRQAIGEWMRKETLPQPAHDLSTVRGWLLMAAVAAVFGMMGDMAWHSRNIAGWLAGLAVCTALVLADRKSTRLNSSHT